MSHGGAREGSGRKPKYDYLGYDGDTRPVRMPVDMTDKEIEEAILNWLTKKKKKK